jgi:hypothetical protein
MSLLVLLLGACESAPSRFSIPTDPLPAPGWLGDAPPDTGGWDPDAPLPLLLAEAEGPIVPEERVGASLAVITAHDGSLHALGDTPRALESRATLEIRGASSSGFPKHSFNLELQDALGADRAVPLLGLPAEADWVLYGPYTDKTGIRDALAYGLARRMGGYAPRVRFAELSLGGVWQGLYQVTEKPEIDPHRVAFPEAAPGEWGDLSGAYLFKYEGGAGTGGGWRSAHGVRYDFQDPSADAITDAQLAWLTRWMDGFESGILAGDAPATWIDVTSFADAVILNELSRNVDAYRRSTFFTKAPDAYGGLLHAGPAWDYNLAWGNADFCAGDRTDGLVWETKELCSDTLQIPAWYMKILRDPRFTAPLRCRWESLRGGVLADDAIVATIDTLARPLAAAEARDQAIWRTMGVDIWPNSYVGATWEDELAYVATFTTTRAAWLDANLPGRCPPDVRPGRDP